ncbi:hypothetical protein NDU88_008641 [Pleurodeles waltl]|uniref:Uncharacterized protein n=1 Tax=Pleurodeles waltl TaxID=8319 RepID=A0AAV7RSZ1_PLEWA|nr:hypothetical protein NDU88_008641 [Pleurodeles waltl]
MSRVDAGSSQLHSVYQPTHHQPRQPRTLRHTQPARGDQVGISLQPVRQSHSEVGSPGGPPGSLLRPGPTTPLLRAAVGLRPPLTGARRAADPRAPGPILLHAALGSRRSALSLPGDPQLPSTAIHNRHWPPDPVCRWMSRARRRAYLSHVRHYRWLGHPPPTNNSLLIVFLLSSTIASYSSWLY